MLRFFHRPLLIAKLTYYEYLIKNNKKQSTAEYKIKRIIKEVTGEEFNDLIIYNSGLSTPKLTRNGFQATAIYVPKYKELLLIFRGSEREDISDWFYNYTGIVSGANTSQLESAISFVKFLKKNIPNFDECYKVATGHSLGGHLAISVELLKSVFQRVYTYNSALPQLQQLRKYDKRFNRKLTEYTIENNIEWTDDLSSFAAKYYAKKSHHIYNYMRKNDFVESINMTVGTFRVGKRIEYPPLLNKFVDPNDYLTKEDTHELDRLFRLFYQRLLEKGITPEIAKDKPKEVAEEFVSLLIEEIKVPIQNQISHISIFGNKKLEETSNVSNAYKTFRAVYNYMLYLAHSGIIPDDIIDNNDGKKANSLFEDVINKETASKLKNLLKPLQEFYVLTKAIYLIAHAKEFEDFSGWVEVAKAHDLPPFYDVLE